MRHFAVHIILKDTGYLILFWILLKYNLTHETYLPETVNYYPAAPSVGFGEIIVYAFLLSIIPMFVSFIIYAPIILLVDKLYKSVSYISLFTSAILLSLTTPIVYIVTATHNTLIYADESTKVTKIVALLVTFILSIVLYVFLNKNKIGQKAILLT
jgi:hypothetical protein